MSKRQIQATQEGKELLIIEDLSQQLEALFKDIQHLRRENFLFESYFVRIQKEHSREQEQLKKRPPERRRDQKRTYSLLTPEQKYQIAQLQSQNLKQSIQKGRIRSDAILETLRAILQQTDQAIAQIKKDAYDFQRDILLGGENSRTGNIEAQKIEKFFQEKDRQKRDRIEKFKNKKKSLQQKIAKTANLITKKEEMGDELKFIDFHQLQIENKKYVKEIQQKNQKLLDAKINSGKISAQLLEAKKRLNEIVSQIAKFQKDILEKEKTIVDLAKAKQEHTEKNTVLENKKRILTTQAEHMRTRDSGVPDTMSYILQKREEENLLYDKKNLERKINIARQMYQKAKKALDL